MDELKQVGSVFLELFFQSPVAFICAIIMLLYILRGMGWHAMYAYSLVMGAYAVSQTIGFTEFISGVIVGVSANELFRFMREQLEYERKPKT